MERQSLEQKKFLMEASKRYNASLLGSPGADHLAKRGLQDEEFWQVVQTFKLGYVDDPLPGHQKYRGMLAIPYLKWAPGTGWSVVSIRFRNLRDNGPKYMTVAGDRPRLFNTLEITRNDDWIAITEGELDAVMATACGVPAVAVPGANAWQPHFRMPFLGYEAVYILADGDKAGEEFGDTVKKTLPNGKVIPMEDGEDVNSVVLKGGRQALIERIGL